MEIREFLRDGGLRQDTWGYEILDELDVAPEDWFVEKNRLSRLLPDEPRARPRAP